MLLFFFRVLVGYWVLVQVMRSQRYDYPSESYNSLAPEVPARL